MQVRVIEKEAKEKGPQFLGKMLDMTWEVKLWLKGQDPDQDEPVFTKPIKHDFSRHDEPEKLAKQDKDIDDYLEEESKKAIATYLNEQSLMTDKHITDRTSTLTTKLTNEYGEI